MTRADIVRWVAARQEALNRRDAAGLTRLFAPDGVVESPTAGRTVRGQAAIDQIHRAWTGGFPDVTFTTDELVIDDREQRLAWIVTVAGTDSGGFMGLPPTGRPFAVPMALFTTLRDGLIASEQRVYDFTRMLVQVGILKARAVAPLPTGVHPDPPSSSAAGAAAADAASTREEIAAILAARQRAWATHDVRALVAQHADDCVMDSHLAGPVTGSPAIADVYAAWFASFPDSQLTSEEVVVDGGRVVELATMTGTATGGFLGLPSTGKPFRVQSVWVYTLRGGRFVHVRPIYDFTGLLVQIGALKAMPE